MSAQASAVTRAVLFDLDGTLIDSAPDLAGAINAVRRDRGLPEQPYERLRAQVGAGARGMVAAAFGIAPGEPEFESLKDAFLTHYQQHLLDETRVFAAVEPMLQALERAGIAWGIVTNKAERYALPVAQGLGLAARTPCVVAGDTTPHAKPHPAPLLEGARRLGVAANECIYVGDDLRDIQAARAAAMPGLAAAWGYLGEQQNPANWGADAVLAEPGELLAWLGIE